MPRSNGYAQQQAATQRMLTEMQVGVGRIHDESEAELACLREVVNG